MSEAAKAPRTPKKRSIDWLALAAVLVVTLVVIHFYTDTFGTARSPLKGDWGTFGDFIGGVMNPFIGFITVILVLRTLAVTKEESETTRKEMQTQNGLLRDEIEATKTSAKLQEIERCMEAITKELTTALDGTVPSQFLIGLGDLNVPNYTNMRTDKSSILGNSSTLLYIDNAMLGSPGHTCNPAYKNMIRANWTSSFFKELALVRELSDYCNLYQKLSETRYALNYYKMRAASIANCLFSLELITQAQWELLMPTPYNDEELFDANPQDSVRTIWLGRMEHSG